MMIKGYISPKTPIPDLDEIVSRFKDANIDFNNIVLNQDFGSFLQTVTDGDTIVVATYIDLFGGLTELFSTILELSERNIILRSLDESMIVGSTEQLTFIKMLHELSTNLHASRTKKGLVKARENGKQIGRPKGSSRVGDKVKNVIRFRKISDISIEKACRMAGCAPSAYYNYIKNVSK